MARQLTRTVWALSAFGAVAIHAGCVALALGSMRPEDQQDLGAPAIEIGVELSLTAARADRPARGAGHRCFGRGAGSCRTEDGRREDRPAKGDATRERRSGSSGTARRLQAYQAHRAENRFGASRAFAGVCCDRGDRHPHRGKCAAVAPFGRPLAGNRSQRRARARHLAKRAGCALQQIQALSGRPTLPEPPRSSSASSWTVLDTSCRPAS